MQERVKPRKRALNLSVDETLVDAAKAEGLNISALLEAALHVQLKERRWLAWRASNRVAIEASNRELEENGLWSDRYRVW